MASVTVGEMKTEPKARVFISYSRKDMAFTDQLDVALKVRGFNPLIDRSEIYAFEDWWQRIEALISRADTVVFVLSPDAITSDIALKEVAYAQSLNKRFAPIVCRQVEVAAVPGPLRRLNFIFFDDPTCFEASADQLAKALQTDIGWIRQHTEYGEAARRWWAAERPDGLLLRPPALEEAEHWIAARPESAPVPTPETQTFILKSRATTTRRRNFLTGSLAAGLAIAVILIGLIYWQRQIALEQRDRAEKTLTAATGTANDLVMKVAVKIRNRLGIPVDLVRDIIKRAQDLLNNLSEAGNLSVTLRNDIAIALRELATTSLMQGDLANALEAAQESQAIMLSLVAKDRDNAQWQRELALSFNRIGEVLTQSGRHDDALKMFELALEIRQRLADAQPENNDAKRDLAVSHERIGDAQLATDEAEGALRSYRIALSIREALLAGEPKNGEWERDLSVSLEKLGDANFQIGDFKSSLDFYTKSFAIRSSLAKDNQTDTEGLRDLAISFAKMGDTRLKLGDREAALVAYNESLAVREKLAETDQDNVRWQADLIVILFKLGNCCDDPKGSYARALKIARTLGDKGKLTGDLKGLITRLEALSRR
jgi:tetratricopeptide (TPR) repeat protein